MDKNIFPDIRRDDIVYTYKERAFTGFAPCFQNGVYSLACCKGAKNGKGMRQSVCRTIDEGKTVWILAIAAGDINRKDYNTSGILYNPGDAIYLAKIDRVCTWQEYSTDSVYSKRKDSYYVLKNGKVEWRSKVEKLHDTPEYKERDCGIGACNSNGRSEVEIFTTEKQILIASEYYIFNKGQQISANEKYKMLDVTWGFKCNDGDGILRAEILNDFLQENNSFFCYSGTDPFNNPVVNKGGCCK